MTSSVLQIIPTLLLTGGEFSTGIANAYVDNFKRKIDREVCGVEAKMLERFSEIQDYLCGPLPLVGDQILRGFGANRDRIRVHKDWMVEQSTVRIVLICDRTWIDEQKTNDFDTSAFDSVDRRIVLVVCEDSDDYFDQMAFEDLFEWIGSLDCIETCWWLDNQTQEVVIPMPKRETQLPVWLECLTCGEAAGFLLRSDAVTKRIRSGSTPQIIGSFQVFDLPLARFNVSKVLVSLFVNRYLFAEKANDSEDPRFYKHMEGILQDFASKSRDISAGDISAYLKDLLLSLFAHEGKTAKVESAKKVITIFNRMAVHFESIQDIRFIQKEQDHFVKTLQKFKKEKRSYWPTGITKKKPSWLWTIILIIALLLLNLLVYWLIKGKILFLSSLLGTSVLAITLLSRAATIVEHEKAITSKENQADQEEASANGKEDRHQVELSEIIVLLRHHHDFVEQFIDIYLSGRFDAILPEELKDIGALLEQVSTHQSMPLLRQFTKDHFLRWLKWLVGLIDRHPDFEKLYPIWIERIAGDIERDSSIDHASLSAILVAVLNKLHDTLGKPGLLWRMDNNLCDAACIIENGLDIEEEHLTIFEGSHIFSGTVPDRLKLIYYGQYKGS